MSHARPFALAFALLFAISCSTPVDLKQALQVTDVSSGYFDAGVTAEGANKLVPSVTFRLRDSSGKLSRVALNVVFRVAASGEDKDEIFKQRVDLADGQTELLTLRSQAGFTGTPPQSRLDMLKNSNFQDMEAVIMVREVAAQWLELHRIPIERQLLTK
ncbi:MAG: hypothetical protein M3541_21210 [Acidobacteriota bacterium]|nr:hypothetical protein [Acidobacteriota bacterium]